MEEEISLKEIFITLWQGRYIIIIITVAAAVIAALASLLFITPMYRASALIDISVYHNQVRDISSHPGITKVISETLSEARQEGDTFESAGISEAREGLLEVEVSASSSQVAADTANTLGIEVLRWLKNHELEEMYRNKEQIEGTLATIDEQIHGLELDNYHQDLLAERENLTNALDRLDQFVIDNFGQLDAAEEDRAMEVNPAYQAIKTKEGQLLTELFDVEQSINRLEAAGRIDLQVIHETNHGSLAERKEDLRYNLAEISFNINHYESLINDKHTEEFLYPAESTGHPYNVRWQLNTAVAFVLGLMLSVMVVFVKPYIGELAKEVRSAKDSPES